MLSLQPSWTLEEVVARTRQTYIYFRPLSHEILFQTPLNAISVAFTYWQYCLFCGVTHVNLQVASRLFLKTWFFRKQTFLPSRCGVFGVFLLFSNRFANLRSMPCVLKCGGMRCRSRQASIRAARPTRGLYPDTLITGTYITSKLTLNFGLK